MMTGMATPTVAPLAVMVGKISCFLDSFCVVKALWRVVSRPSALRPTIFNEYFMPGSSSDCAVHVEPSGASEPSTCTAPALGSA